MKKQKLYTFVTDWNGGTYVSQFSGNNLKITISVWLDSIDIKTLKITQADKNNFIKDAISEDPINLDGIINTWCISPSIKEKVATVNIIETSPPSTKNSAKEISLKGPFRAKDIRAFRDYNRIYQLEITDQKAITAEIAKGFTSLQSVQIIRLWCSITRTAMRHIINIPDLEELYILGICRPGRLENFISASSLKVFQCNYSLLESDLLEIAKSPNIQKISAQGSVLSREALNALLQMQNLTDLDIEGTEFNDAMAKTISISNKIKKLRVCNNPLSAKGLKNICKMSQLRTLDIWATDIVEKDLELLTNLPNLESLSIGNLDEQSILTFKGVLPHLKNIPSLKRIWLDGISLTDDEKKYLEKQYESVRY